MIVIKSIVMIMSGYDSNQKYCNDYVYITSS